ncbi:MAG: ribosome maturation factor RimM [Actinomycetota bacterium]|nr:ribosome maturation factor RimM [Actinomycetota bacterium]MDH4354332.1 ribosome maturation factor RimM [Actinomycetota bacterium]
MEVVVGRVGRAHGVRGDVGVEVRTDEPDRRFAPGAVLATEPASFGPLTVSRARWHSGRLLLTFEQVVDRTAAEALRGVELVVEVDPGERPTDSDEHYDRHLRGLEARTPEGLLLGRVSDVVHLPAQDLLEVTDPAGHPVLVPFVTALVPEVDVTGGRIVVDPPPGLFGDVG